MRNVSHLKDSFQRELKFLIYVFLNITIFCHNSFSGNIQTGSKSGGGHTGNMGSMPSPSFSNNNFSEFRNGYSKSLFGNSDDYYPVLQYMLGKKRDTCSSGPITGAIEYNRKRKSVKVNVHQKEINKDEKIAKDDSIKFSMEKDDNKKYQHNSPVLQGNNNLKSMNNYRLSIPSDAIVYKEYINKEDSILYVHKLEKKSSSSNEKKIKYIFAPRWGKKVFWGYDIKIVSMVAPKLEMFGFGCATDLDMNIRLLKMLGVRISAGYSRCKSDLLKSYFFWKKDENSIVDDTGFLSEKYYISQTFLTFNVWTSYASVSIGEVYCSIGGGSSYNEETLQGYSMEWTGIADEHYLRRTSQKQYLWKPLLSTGCGFNSPMRSKVVCLGFELRYLMQINPNKKELPVVSDNTPFIHFFMAGLKVIL